MSAIHSSINIQMLNWATENWILTKPKFSSKVSELPDELIQRMYKFWLTMFDKNTPTENFLQELHEQYHSAKEYETRCQTDYDLGKLSFEVYYITMCFCDNIREKISFMELLLPKTSEQHYQCMECCSWFDSVQEQDTPSVDVPEWAELPAEEEQEQENPAVPEWAAPPAWTGMDDDEEEFEEELEEEKEPVYVEDTAVPSLYDEFDPEMELTCYLRIDSDHDLFMDVMFTDNQFQYSEIVPDRLYNYLPEELKEIVDDYQRLMNIACNAHNSPKEKFEFENTDFPLEIESLCYQLGEYIAHEEQLPFAYVFIAKFIREQILTKNP